MAAAVELRNMSVCTEGGDGADKRAILQNINVRVGYGEWVTVLGLNGSGKSTLARALAGLRLPNMRGEAVRAFAPMPVPIVLQQPEAALLGATPWEDVVLMLEQYGNDHGQRIEQAELALTQVGLAGCMHQPIAALSGGQKQLAAIAGCIAVQAPMLVLDEVTAMLHPEAAAAVRAAVRELHRQGTTVIWITQHLEELSSQDRLLVLEQGSITYDGDVPSFFARTPIIESDAQLVGTDRLGSAAAPINGAAMSLCEKLGFEPPYCVQVGWELEALGFELPRLPLTPEELVATAGSLLLTGGTPA